MLVLTRESQERIVIGKDIEITVVSISNGKVKLGVSAPKNVSIHRKEVFDFLDERGLTKARHDA